MAWASVLMEPSDIAPVANRLTISLADFDLFNRDGLARIEFELEQPAQRHVAAVLVVDQLGVLFVGVPVV